MEWLAVGRRRLGTALVVFGAIGVLLAGILGVGLVAGAGAMRDLDDRLTTQQVALADALDRASSSLGQLADATANASTTLATSGVAVGHAGEVLDELANVSRDLAQTLDISILGQRPLATAASKFGDLAGRAQVFSDDAAALAAALATNATDAAALATQVGTLEDRAAVLATEVRAFEGMGKLVGLLTAGMALAGLLVAWFGVLAVGIAWAGWRLRRAASPAAPQADPAREPGDP